MKQPLPLFSRRLAAACCPCLILAALFLAGCDRPKPGVFYVAEKGNDQWSGGRSTPNSGGTDGPFATVKRALEATRQWRTTQSSAGRVEPTIYIGAGTYELAEPLVLQAEDSNLKLEGMGKGQVVLSGGRLITGWKQTEREGKQVWVAELPEVREGHWYFRELWVSGVRAVRARTPNEEYFKVAGVVDSTKGWTDGQARFEYHPGDLNAANTSTQGEVVVMNRWVDSRLPVTGLDEAKHLVDFGKRAVFALDKDDLYYLEGTMGSLDQPGEWYLDRPTGMLYYLPRPGELLSRCEVFAPDLTQVVRLEGKPEQDKFVENVTFRGLTFAHTEWCFPEGFSSSKDKPAIFPAPEPQVGGFGQAEVGVPGAVWGAGVRGCRFENCAFVNLGDYGLELARGCQSNVISHCDFSELGAGGLKLGETVLRSKPSEQTRANEVSDCSIRNGGLMFHSAIGVWIGQSPDNRIIHNEIHDFYYTGISIGWTWGYGPALASNNLVAFNHVHHIGVKAGRDGPILSDMGGIYTLGLQPGTRIENNLWHDVAGLRYGGWGIYFDEGSSGIVAISNVVYRTTHGGFHQHYGETNIVENNVFAFGHEAQLQRTRVEPHLSFTFETNIVYFDSAGLLVGDWSQDQYKMDWNVYFDKRSADHPDQLRFAKDSLEQWRARGHDVHSILADPLFVDPDKYDFSLRPDSPALKIGFHPIDLKGVGPRPQTERQKQ